MPQIGEIKYGKELGKNNAKGNMFQWLSCSICGKERWVMYHKVKGYRHNCSQCANKETGKKRIGCNSEKWKGGRFIDSQGYVKIWVSPQDDYYPMAGKDKYILEHRLIMAKYLGRFLTRKEIIHHKNGIKTDNRIENLELLPNSKSHMRYLGCSNCELRKQIRLLEWEVKELKIQVRNLMIEKFLVI